MGLPVFKSAGDPADPAVLLVHGYPASSYMWVPALQALAARGLYAVAPDLPGFGDSEPDPPGTWARHVEALEALRQAEGLERVALVGHDWGGLIGLRWACDHPDAVWAVVASDTGFFPDGRWHGMANTLRTEGEGEQLVENVNRELLAMALRQVSPALPEDALDEYWKAFGDADRRRAHLDLYRSGDFAELEAYDGCLGRLGVPTLIVWGAKDEFAPVGGAHRFHKQVPDARLVVLDDAGHYVMEDAPERVGEELREFLATVCRAPAAPSGGR
jgi:haloalkane dehalogenase